MRTFNLMVGFIKFNIDNESLSSDSTQNYTLCLYMNNIRNELFDKPFSKHSF